MVAMEKSLYAIILRRLQKGQNPHDETKYWELPVVCTRELRDAVKILNTDEDFVNTYMVQQHDHLVIVPIH